MKSSQKHKYQDPTQAHTLSSPAIYTPIGKGVSFINERSRVRARVIPNFQAKRRLSWLRETKISCPIKGKKRLEASKSFSGPPTHPMLGLPASKKNRHVMKKKNPTAIHARYTLATRPLYTRYMYGLLNTRYM